MEHLQNITGMVEQISQLKVEIMILEHSVRTPKIKCELAQKYRDMSVLSHRLASEASVASYIR